MPRPSASVVTGRRTVMANKWLLVGAALGAAVGLLVGLAFAVVPFRPVSFPVRLLLFGSMAVISGAGAGATIAVMVRERHGSSAR
jgi:hypothetical protein